MKRNEWTFTYTADELEAAAEQKRKHHADRLAWWEQKKQEVMEKIATSGITVQESPGAGASNVSRGYTPQIRIDNTLETDLTECACKMEEHRSKERSFAGWVQVLNANPKSSLELEHDDYLFFFGK